MGSPTSQARPADRRARVEEIRRQEQARTRRNRVLAITACTVVLAGLVGGGVWLVNAVNDSDGGGDDGGSKTAAAGSISGEKTWSGLTQNHVGKTVAYPMSPPAGGDHSPVWQNCNGDVYDKPLTNENAVHSLEHGAVWVTYTGEAADADVKALGARVAKTPYSLMSPFADQASPITLTAWGHQLGVAKADDPRVATFFDTYVQGKQTPEPGAPCTGGKAS
ncbi:DUF3105 domain-containing protein [Streptomyces sp. ME01-24h]|nr:DUF3105 domain-containing protein [Streptomyces sp. ME19-03-3]MDX3355234.1 DUF3105 domain-containing protein [Streptomyces sp. ME01-24h]